MITTPASPVGRASEMLEERMRRAIAVHFDPAGGSAFWLQRAAALGIDGRRQVYTLDELALLGETTPDDLRSRPLMDFVPRRFHDRMDHFIVGQTGGTTGEGLWTAYRQDEFAEAFVLPFVEAAGRVAFPGHEPWLFIGPSGPHIIGKVVRQLANALGSADPFSVDFDPRWARKLVAGSFARQRYLEHVLNQALALIHSQRVGVLFTTPAVLEPLAAAMTVAQRLGIRGVHYGGMEVTPDFLERMQLELFPNAVHLSGYGNTLFGCCLELAVTAGRPLDYYSYGSRLHFEVVDERGDPRPVGSTGRVRFSRFDESFLIVRCRERDEATLIPSPDPTSEAFGLAGLRNPHSIAAAAQTTAGLY